jgi:hypothetical protein
MRTRQRLRHAPGGAGVGCCQRLDHTVEGQDVCSAAVEPRRHQHPQDSRLVDRGDDFVGDAPVALGAFRARCYDRCKAARPADPID